MRSSYIAHVGLNPQILHCSNPHLQLLEHEESLRCESNINDNHDKALLSDREFFFFSLTCCCFTSQFCIPLRCAQMSTVCPLCFPAALLCPTRLPAHCLTSPLSTSRPPSEVKLADGYQGHAHSVHSMLPCNGFLLCAHSYSHS